MKKETYYKYKAKAKALDEICEFVIYNAWETYSVNELLKVIMEANRKAIEEIEKIHERQTV